MLTGPLQSPEGVALTLPYSMAAEIMVARVALSVDLNVTRGYPKLSYRDPPAANRHRVSACLRGILGPQGFPDLSALFSVVCPPVLIGERGCVVQRAIKQFTVVGGQGERDGVLGHELMLTQKL